jgi:adenosine deaminase
MSAPASIRAAAARLSWTPDRLGRLIRGLPKAETHLHLDGALSPAAIKSLAISQDYAPLKDKEEAEIAALSVVDRPRSTLGEVLAAFGVVYPLLRTPDAVALAAREAAAGAARAGALYAEVRFAPALHAKNGFSAEHALRAALRGLRGAEIETGVILCLLRPPSLLSREKNEETLELALTFKDRGVVAVDVAGDEAAQPLSDFAELLRRAQSAGLKVTAHAGESPHSGDLETALDLGVDRVGHATLLAHKPHLVPEFARRRLPIEVNLTSNLRTSEVARISEHPAKEWRRAGIPLALSTDDPGLFGVDLNHEYGLLVGELGFAAADVIDVAFDSVDALFLSEDRKRALRERFTVATAELLASLGQDSTAEA